MAHHLAELIVSAENDETTTAEQRHQVIDTILKVWSHRRHYPSKAPLEEFSKVFTALDRLGDSTPWKFSRLFEDIELPGPNASDLPLVATAVKLEHLTRETMIRLVYLAAQDAREKNRRWIEAADKIEVNLESEVTATLTQLRRRAARRRVRAGERTPSESHAATPAEESSTEGAHQGEAESVPESESADDHVLRTGENLVNDEEGNDAGDLLSDANHVRRLREMVDLLNTIADALTVHSATD